MVERVTAAHLFDGIGGFHLAADRVGMTTLWSSENDKHASAVLHHHWPDIRNYGDIHDIDRVTYPEEPGDEIRGFVPPAVDVLTGGFPCQDYSVAGTRGGLAGDRGALWWEFLRVITSIRPAWVVGENVPGLLSSRDGADFETIVGSLTECGYGVVWGVLDAQYFGVAQRRRRVFIVGHSGGQPRPEVLALGEGVFGHPEPSRETGPRVAALTANGLGGGGPDDNLAQAGHLTIGFNARQEDAVPSYEQAATLDAGLPIGGVLTQTLAATLTQGAPSAGRRNEDDINLVATSVAVRGRADGQEWELGEPGVANALRAGDGGSSRGNWMTDSAQVRRLTPLECERLQGFPDGWTDIPGNSDTQRYRQLGNAVAVPVAEWILERIVWADG